MSPHTEKWILSHLTTTSPFLCDSLPFLVSPHTSCPTPLPLTCTLSCQEWGHHMCEGWGDGTGMCVPKSKASCSPSDHKLLECESSCDTGPTFRERPTQFNTVTVAVLKFLILFELWSPHFFFLFFFFWQCQITWEILALTRAETQAAVKAPSPNQWTARIPLHSNLHWAL